MSATEPIQVVEIILPTCENTFGVSPCTATADVGGECFNTFGTCQDQDNFVKGEKSYLFTHGDASSRYPGALAMVKSISNVPTTLNFAGASQTSQGLGTRSRMTISFNDRPSNDLGTDPYQATRTYDAMTQGTYWTKFLVRNKFLSKPVVNVYEGYAGQDISEMTKLTGFWIDNTWPTEGGDFSITVQDVIALLEAEEAQVPALSSGLLAEDIDDSQTSIIVENATLTDYDAAGTVRINSEVMTYTSTEEYGDTGITLLDVTRGSDGTDADEHSLEDLVQRCVRFTEEPIPNVVDQVMSEDYEGNIPSEYLDLTQWEEEVAINIPDYVITELLTEPTKITIILSQIQEQNLLHVWWEERESKVLMRVVRGYSAAPDLLTDSANIMSGFQITPNTDQRVSQMWYYYRQDDATASDTDLAGFARARIQVDAESEGVNAYDSTKSRTITANWVRDRFMAADVENRYMLRFKNVPRSATWTMAEKDSGYGVGDVVLISHHLDVDQFGARNIGVWMITSYTPNKRGGTVSYKAEDVTAYGRIYTWQDASAPDFDPLVEREFDTAYWGDEDGLISDGSIGAVWG